MTKINSLQVYNFKFFDEQDPIILNGKHLLLYGENGSGKSSLYWALYTLFESSIKSNNQIQKYFKHYTEDEESLINIHSEPIYTGISNYYDSFIEVKTTHPIPETYKISLVDTAINTNNTAREIHQASDFINYKVLYKFQDFVNSEVMDLASIFIKNILPYVTFPQKKLLINGNEVLFSNAYEMYKQILKGPGTTVNAKGKTIQVYKDSLENTTFNEFAKHFDEQLSELIDFINANASDMIQKLGYDITFKLNYIKFKYHKADVNFNFEPFKIEFILTKYLGKEININRPQSFLNEAKIAAIAIAIRLTILQKRINGVAPDLLKFIVLDDVMISLDMNNRDRLIEFLLDSSNRFTEDYQLLFLTHDRSLFHYLKDKIRNANLKDDFVYKEVYVDNLSDFEKPKIYDYPNKLEKAKYYLQKHDYPACGIYLRTMCEEVLKRLLPKSLQYGLNQNNETVNLNLNSLIDNFQYFCNIEGLEFERFKDLKTYKSVVLNTLAHNDIHSPLYREELVKVLNVLTELDIIKRDYILKKNDRSLKGSDYIIKFVKNDGNIYQIGFKLIDELYLLVDYNNNKRISNYCKSTITYINDNGTETKNLSIDKESIQQIINETCEKLNIPTFQLIDHSIFKRGEELVIRDLL